MALSEFNFGLSQATSLLCADSVFFSILLFFVKNAVILPYLLQPKGNEVYMF